MEYQSAEKGTEGRRLLEERLVELEAETPQYIFETRDSYQKIIRNQSRTEIRAGLFHGHIFFFPIPGVIETIEYKGLKMSYPGLSIDNRSSEETWDGLGTLCLPNSFGTFHADLIYGLFIDGVNYRFKLYDRETRQVPDEKFDERVKSLFDRLRTFEQKTQPKSRFLKPVYDIATRCGL